MRRRRSGLPADGLAAYLRAVADAVGVPASSGGNDHHAPATAFLPLPQRSPERDDRDLLLVWGEQDGWLIAAESPPDEPPIVLAYLGQDVLPPPPTVARFAADVIAGRRPGQLLPPGFRRPNADDGLAERLTRYATAG